VKLLVANGATVINGDLKPPQGLTEKEAASVAFQKTDVSDWDSLRSLFDKAVTHAGRIDHVFANAGAPPRTTFMDLEVDDNGHPLEPTHRVLDINLKGLINTVALAIHHMKHQKQSEGGSILITSSAAGT
jgi:NAD(P)-dependent dehydrogenase (short-subunit alcohol dehydrogenase family)